jgi:hypothetical protein
MKMIRSNEAEMQKEVKYGATQFLRIERERECVCWFIIKTLNT